MTGREIGLIIDGYEALVLSDWLSRSGYEDIIKNEVVKNILWRIEAQLDKLVVDVFSDDYPEKLEFAKGLLKERYGI